MRTHLGRIATFLCLVMVTASMFACEAKITKSNFDKIEVGMTLSQVNKILGGKGEDETASGTSITGAGIGEGRAARQEVYRWKDGGSAIIVTVVNGKVTSKMSEGL